MITDESKLSEELKTSVEVDPETGLYPFAALHQLAVQKKVWIFLEIELLLYNVYEQGLAQWYMCQSLNSDVKLNSQPKMFEVDIQ